MKHILLIAIIAALTSCNNEKPVEIVETQAPPVVDITAPDSVTQTFMLPDSINTGLIIATYVEIDPESHTILIYANNDKKAAKLVRYLNDGSVTTDKLQIISETNLRSADKKYDFTINDSFVVSKLPNGKLLEHFRTDANN